MVSRYCGEAYALESNQPPEGSLMTPRGNFTGQLWKVIPQAGGYYRLNSKFMEGRPKEYALESSGPDKGSLMTPWGPFSGQLWKLTPIGPVAPNVAVPALDPKGDPYKTEGPTDYDFYARPSGTVKAVMVFVDFSDAPAGSRATKATGDHLLGKGAAQKLFTDQSYGNLTLDVTRVDGWKRMPGDGVLIYSVDATKATGCHPVKVYSKHASDLWKAPWVGGDKFTDPAAPMTVDVQRKVGDGYAVRIRRR
jgi:hypothetical protein